MERLGSISPANLRLLSLVPFFPPEISERQHIALGLGKERDALGFCVSWGNGKVSPSYWRMRRLL